MTLSQADAELLKDAGALKGLSFATAEGIPRTPLYRPDEPPVARRGPSWTRTGCNTWPTASPNCPACAQPLGWSRATCTLGPCAWCGIVKAKGWAQRDHKWTDGSDAALCQSCAVIFDRYAYDLWSSDWSTQRGALAEAISGVPCMLGEKGPTA